MIDFDKTVAQAVKDSHERYVTMLNNGGYKPSEKTPMSQEYKDYIEKMKTSTVITPKQEDVVSGIWTQLHKRANNGEFIPSEKQKHCMNFLFKYFSIQNSKKGVCIIGSYGSGKTELMKAFCTTRFHQYDAMKSGYVCHITSSIEMVDYYNKDSNFDKFFENNLYIDDFGSEQKAKYMSKDAEPILSKFIELWYIKCRDKRLFITTNLSTKELKEMYGARVYSRLKGTVDFKVLNDKDHRE